MKWNSFQEIFHCPLQDHIYHTYSLYQFTDGLQLLIFFIREVCQLFGNRSLIGTGLLEGTAALSSVIVSRIYKRAATDVFYHMVVAGAR